MSFYMGGCYVGIWASSNKGTRNFILLNSCSRLNNGVKFLSVSLNDRVGGLEGMGYCGSLDS